MIRAHQLQVDTMAGEYLPNGKAANVPARLNRLAPYPDHAACKLVHP